MPCPFGLARLAAGGVLQAREDVDTHGHQTSGQAEQQNRLLSDLGNDGARQGEHIRHGGDNGFHSTFCNLCASFNRSRIHGCVSFLKNFLYVNAAWGLALQPVIAGDYGYSGGLIIKAGDEGAIVRCLLVVYCENIFLHVSQVGSSLLIVKKFHRSCVAVDFIEVYEGFLYGSHIAPQKGKSPSVSLFALCSNGRYSPRIEE